MPGPDVNLSELIRNSTTESVKANIRQIAKDLAGNRYMALAVVHAALALYDRHPHPKQKQHTEEHGGAPEQPGVLESSGDAASDQRAKTRGEAGAGLHHSSKTVVSFLEKFARDHDWSEISKLKTLAGYSNLRAIILDEYKLNTDGQRSRYFLFLAMLLIYLVERAASDLSLKEALCFAALKLFEIEQYLDELFAAGSEKAAPYEFPKSQKSAPNLAEVLKSELGIENPSNPSISDFFKVPISSPARYVCYRYTTHINPGRNARNSLTKSYTEIEPPRDGRNVYSFSHKYQDLEGLVRSTSGFVVRSAQTFYFVGGSVRGEVAIGAKIIAIPAHEHNTWYAHEFISGLVLSNDSELNPIAARFFMVRTGAGPRDEADLIDRYSGRIEEKEFLSDVKSHAVNPRPLTKTYAQEFLAALSNRIDVRDGLETPLVPFVKKTARR